MGFLSKLKDKVTKTLKKVTPKEIAPFLPLAAMVLPGSGILASSASKFLVPQLLAAAGSSRTAGEINPLNQILAGFGSMSAINAANAANVAPTIGNTGAFASTLPQTPAIKAATTPGFLDKAAAGMSGLPGIGKGMNIMSQGQQDLLSLLPGGAPATFSKSMLAPAGAGLGMFTLDAAKKAQKDYEDEQAAAAAVNSAYGDARSDLAAAIARFSDPINRYGNNPFGDFNPVTGQLLNTGGRVGYAEGDIVGDDELSQRLYGEMMGAQMSDNVPEIFNPMNPMGGPHKEENIGIYDVLEAFDQKNKEIMDFKRRQKTEGQELRERVYNSYIDRYKQMLEGPAGPSMPPMKSFEEMFPVEEKAMGGRIGMNMGGGLGSIPQTPNVPQGMQLDGRGGGFIPMGAQERKDDVPAMLAKNEFVMTADAVRAAGGGSIEKGAQKMYDVMNQLEAKV